MLDSGRTLETVRVDTTEKLRLQVHGVEGVRGLIVVRLDLTYNEEPETLADVILKTPDIGISFAERGSHFSLSRVGYRVVMLPFLFHPFSFSTYPQAPPQVPCQP